MLLRTLLALVVAVVVASPSVAQHAGKRSGWTLEAAFDQLAQHPRDPYLQYVALQLARRTDRFQVHANRVVQMTRDRSRRRGRGRDVDVFDLFTGALAVQESLQLDSMRNPAGDPGAVPGPEANSTVEIATLVGPTVRSHPWAAMLGGRRPAVSPLSLMVPDDFYLVEFHSVNSLLTALENGDLWSRQVFLQSARDATGQDIAGRIKAQLAIETSKLLRPIYGQVVEQVAIAGSDLYVREGSDVTLLFRLKNPKLFRVRMDGSLHNAAESRAGATRSSGEVLGVKFEHVTTPDRAVHVFSAYPDPDLHVRSNSKVALGRILAAIKGKDAGGRAVRRLGETDEFAYIRGLMPWSREKEDGFIYLSDPFIRRLVGPQVKLTELHRMRCYNHLRMIGHAAMLYRTEHGAPPPTLGALAEARCAPGMFGEGALACPDHGTYRLGADGASGACSHHGHARALTPCCEIPLSVVTRAEAKEYETFLTEYSSYWRTFFDPIALQLRLRPDSYRVETMVLPLIDNSIYTNMAAALGGEPQSLDALPVPTSNIFSIAMKFDKQPVLQEIGGLARELRSWVGRDQLSANDVDALLRRGIGDQISLNVCDADPMFDFSLPSALGEMLGSFRGRGRMENEWLAISFLIASLNSPVYVAIPVRDAQVVDDFLAKMDGVLAMLARRPSTGGWFEVDNDFYRLPDIQGHQVRCGTIGFGPIKWRLFWSRIDRGLYVASKRSTLEELMGAKAMKPGPEGHASLRIRPVHWAAILRDFQLGWAEGNRLACLDNLGPLSNVARAFGAADNADPAGSAKPAKPVKSPLIELTSQVYGTRFFCPEQGEYHVSPDGRSVHCSVHGTTSAPRQPAKPAPGSDLGRLLRRLKELTATLTFTEEGLRAVVEIKRK